VKRHDIDVVSLVFGLLFAAFVGWWLLDRVAALDVSGGWAIAAALLVAGGAGLASSLPRRRVGNAQPVSAEPVSAEPVSLVKDDPS
jgi:hypothetical protein